MFGEYRLIKNEACFLKKTTLNSCAVKHLDLTNKICVHFNIANTDLPLTPWFLSSFFSPSLCIEVKVMGLATPECKVAEQLVKMFSKKIFLTPSLPLSRNTLDLNMFLRPFGIS